MKLNLILLFFTLITINNYSQNNRIQISDNDFLTYLDSTHAETQSKNYQYLKIIKDYKFEKDTYSILEYYKSGAIYMQATSGKKEGFPLEGKQSCFYENGNKKTESFYDNGKATGDLLKYHENGRLKEKGEYTRNHKELEKQYKINQFWDEDGVRTVIDGNGFLEDKNEKESSKGAIKNGFKEGDWEGLFMKLKSRYTEKYADGKLTSGESWDQNNRSYFYTELEVKPQPKNGMMDFYKFVGKNYKTPIVKGLRGKVYITFVVEKDGKIVEPVVLRDIGFGTGEEAARVLTMYDGFASGEQRGQKVRCKFSLPISIQSVN